MSQRLKQDGRVELPREVSREYLIHYGVCPAAVLPDGRLEVAVAADRPEERRNVALADLARAYDRQIATRVTDAAAFGQAVERLTSVENDDAADEQPDAHADTDARNLATQPPVIRYVNFLLREAYDRRASDVHIESYRDRLAVRMRVDGVLIAATDVPAALRAAVVSRIKLLGNLDIAERRRPQDGRIRVRLDERALDLRVSTVPTHFGESVVLRILDGGAATPDLAALGIPMPVLDRLVATASRSHGMVLVTGPTGSGKTTTLYATLMQREREREKIVTVEDPVEYELPGVMQVPVNRLAGVTFATSLRSILRQDPDVVMVGEIRDGETAEIAVQAATTGHLVFSTVHTKDAAGAVVRLRDLGVPSFLTAATLELVLAQRLVRRICSECTQAAALDERDQQIAEVIGLAATRQQRGRGCDHCAGTGYVGRAGVFELMQVSPALRSAIGAGAAHEEIQTIAVADGMQSLRASAASLVAAGTTTLAEVSRAVL